MYSCARILLVYKEFRRSRCQNTQHNTCRFLASYRTKIAGTKTSLDLPWCIPSVISNTAGLLSYLPVHSVYISHIYTRIHQVCLAIFFFKLSCADYLMSLSLCCAVLGNLLLKINFVTEAHIFNNVSRQKKPYS